MSRRTLARHRFTRETAEGGGGGTTGGEGSAQTGATGAQAGGATNLGTVQATVVPDGQQPAQTGEQQWDGKVESLHPDVQKMIRDLRQENGQRRTALTAAEQQQREVVRAFAKAAGIPLPDDQQAPDPAQLTQQLTAAQQAQRQTAVELAVYRTAAKHTADPDALLDSRSFLKAVENLDPTADDFAAQVDAAIKTAVDTNPKLKAGRAPGASGADHTGGSGEAPRQFRTPTSLHDAVAQSYAGT